jgi:hypothetical protein
MTIQTKDFSYFDQGLFTMFIPNTKEAEQAWNEMASTTDGTGKVPTVQAKQFIYQLKKAGYTVSKGKKPSISIDDILLDELFN